MRDCRHQTVLCVLTAAACVISSAWSGGAAESTSVASQSANKDREAAGQRSPGGTLDESGLVLGSVEVRRLLTRAWDALDHGDVQMAHTMAEAALERSISARQFGKQPTRILMYIESRRLRCEPSARPATMPQARMANIDNSVAKPTAVRTSPSTPVAPTPKSPTKPSAGANTGSRQTSVPDAAKTSKPMTDVTVVRKLLNRARAELDAGNVTMAHTMAEAAAGTSVPLEKFKMTPARYLREIEAVRLAGPQSKTSVRPVVGARLPSPVRNATAPIVKKPSQLSVAVAHSRSTNDSTRTRAPEKASPSDASGTSPPSSVRISTTPALKKPSPSAVAVGRIPSSPDSASASTLKKPSQPAATGTWLPSSVKISSLPALKKPSSLAVAARQLPPPIGSESVPAIKPPPQRSVSAKRLPSFVKFSPVPTREKSSRPTVAGVVASTPVDSGSQSTMRQPTEPAQVQHVASPIGVVTAVSESPTRVVNTKKLSSSLAPASEWSVVQTNVAKLPESLPPVAPDVKSETSQSPVVASSNADPAWSQFRIVLPSTNRSPHLDRLTQAEVAVKLEPTGTPKLVPAASPKLKPLALPLRLLPVIPVSFDEESLQTADEAVAETTVSPEIAIQCKKSDTKVEMPFSPLSTIDLMAAVRIPTVMVEEGGETKRVDLKTPVNQARTYNNCPEVRNLEAMEWYDFRPSRNTYAFHHYPLYFEDPNLERCGQSRGLLTNFSSAALTLGQLPALPYMMAVQPPHECVRAKADCPTCHEFDLDTYLPEFSLPASAIEAAAVVAFIFLVP